MHLANKGETQEGMGFKKACNSGGQQGKSQAELHSKPTKQAFSLEQEDGGLRWETSGREGMGAR